MAARASRATIGSMNNASSPKTTLASEPKTAGSTPIRRIRIARMPLSGRAHLIVTPKSS